jgi:hypothetical protein
MIQNEFIIERIEKAKLNDLVYLTSTVNSKRTSEKYFQNKFNTQYTGKSFIGFIAYHKTGEPAAFYGVYPCMMTDGKSTFLGCQSGDTITNPKFQKKGLFTKLALQTFDLAREEEISIVYGFPNNNSSYGFFNRLDWRKIGELSSFEFQYSNNNLYNLLNKYKYSRIFYSLYFKIIYQFVKTEGFLNSNNSSNSYSVLHDEKFYLYKKYEKSFFVKLNGFKFWIKFADGILIGDIERFDLAKCIQFYKTLNKLAGLFGVKKITIDCMEDSFLYNLFYKKTESKKSLEVGIYILNKQYSNSDFRFSFGDADTF